MNLKEQLMQAKANLAEVKTAVESGEKGADELKSAIDNVNAIQERIDAAEEAEGLLKSLGSVSGAADPAPKQAKSLGEHVANAVKAANWHRGEKKSVQAAEFKAATDVVKVPAAVSPLTTDVDRRIVTPYQRPTVLDLFATETISGNALTYFVHSLNVDGAFATVAEGATKPQISFGDPTPVTESLKKVAAYFKETDEVLEDTPWLASLINERALYLHELARESQVLNGDGTGTNLTGLLNRSGIQTGTYANADSIFDAMTKVQNATGFAPDAVVINPADYQTLRLAKDANLQYYGGGYFYGQYGANGVVEQPPIWGLRTVVTPAVAQGTVVVGAFKMGASVITKGGVTVEVYNQNEDDAINNRVTVLVESRLALAVRYPQAFVKLTAN